MFPYLKTRFGGSCTSKQCVVPFEYAPHTWVVKLRHFRIGSRPTPLIQNVHVLWLQISFGRGTFAVVRPVETTPVPTTVPLRSHWT